MKCIIVDDEPLSRDIIEKFVNKTDFLELQGSYSNAVDAAAVLGKEKIDLVYLDIEMPEMSGLELLETLNEKPLVVLITAKEEYALQSYSYDVVDYILKPAKYSRFLKSANKARALKEKDSAAVPSGSTLYVKDEGRLVRIEFENILYIEAQGDYVQINTEESKYIVYSTMKKVEEKIPNDQFFRVHRSFIVRLDKIKDIQEGNLLIDRKIIPIGGSYKNDLLKKLNIL